MLEHEPPENLVVLELLVAVGLLESGGNHGVHRLNLGHHLKLGLLRPVLAAARGVLHVGGGVLGDDLLVAVEQ